MPVTVRPLSPELAEKARLELFEDPKKLEDNIAHLKDWIAKQSHLRARTDDQWLAAFLRGCKFSPERTKGKIDLYYSLRSIAPELFVLKPFEPKFMDILKAGVLIAMPKTGKPDDPRVLLMRLGQYDANKYTMPEIFCVLLAIQKLFYMDDDNFLISGVKYVLDFQGGSMKHFTQMTPLLIKKMVVSEQEAAPVRMKSANFLNMPAAFNTILNILKTFLNEKNRNRMHVYGKDYEQLYQQVPKDILPAEYGGSGGTAQEITDHLVKKFEEYKDWFAEDAQYGTDESKRPGKPKTAEDTFGVDGSFRQLDFD